MEDPTTNSPLITGRRCLLPFFLCSPRAIFRNHCRLCKRCYRRFGASRCDRQCRSGKLRTPREVPVPAGIGVPRLAEGDDDHFPAPSFFFAKFDLFIPAASEEFVEGSSADMRTENFRVFVTMTFHGPITFIELLDPDESDIPRGSTAVRVVR